MFLKNKKYIKKQSSVLVFTVIAMTVLTILGLGLLTISLGVRYHAARLKNEAIAMLAAEAGYEKAVYWMEQQEDMAYQVKTKGSYSDSLTFPDSRCNYIVSMYAYFGSRPAYRVVSNGISGRFGRTIEVIVMQAISGWDMGLCRIPSGAHSTTPVNFGDGEVIDLPVHINKADDNPDVKDIFISGHPDFRQEVGMGESRYNKGSGADKYSDVMDIFDNGIEFDQPSSKITNEDIVTKKIDRFKDSTKSSFSFTPVAKAASTLGSSRLPQPAVQLEFFVTAGVGQVRITNNCTVRGYQESSDSRTYDFKIVPGSDGTSFQRYPVYAFHYMPSNALATGERQTWNLTDTYVTQTIGGVSSEPGGQIYVDGNVIIGGDLTAQSDSQVIKGKVTVVATGNIWVADSVAVDGAHDASGLPASDNTNAFGLIAGGVVKVVDPGMTNWTYVESSGKPPTIANSTYVPIGIPDTGQPASSNKRHLGDPTVIEASITVGGGGWGAENVKNYRPGRKVASAPQDDLVLRGTISEAIRGVVGHLLSDGYSKHYYFDKRFLEGLLPGDMWLRGKFVPAPGGWKDYQTDISD